MKTKKYIFRFAVGATAFLFSVGVFSVWRSLPTAAAPTPTIAPVVETAKLAETYPLMPVEADKISPPPPSIVEDKAANEFDPEGHYYFVDGDAPKGFEDFENFTVENKFYDSEKETLELIAPEGYVETEKAFKFRKISLGNGQIQFETERVKGISYTFSGRFTETRNFNYLDFGETKNVLEGRLIKKRSGVKIAEAAVEFGWYIGGC